MNEPMKAYVVIVSDVLYSLGGVIPIGRHSNGSKSGAKTRVFSSIDRMMEHFLEVLSKKSSWEVLELRGKEEGMGFIGSERTMSPEVALAIVKDILISGGEIRVDCGFVYMFFIKEIE